MKLNTIRMFVSILKMTRLFTTNIHISGLQRMIGKKRTFCCIEWNNCKYCFAPGKRTSTNDMPPWLIVSLPVFGCLGVIVFLALLVGLASRLRKRRKDPDHPPRDRRWTRDGNMLWHQDDPPQRQKTLNGGRGLGVYNDGYTSRVSSKGVHGDSVVNRVDYYYIACALSISLL